MRRFSYRVVMSAFKRDALFLPCVGSALSTAVHSLSLSLPPTVSCSGNRVCSPHVDLICLGPVASCLSLAAHFHTSPCFLASLQGSPHLESVFVSVSHPSLWIAASYCVIPVTLWPHLFYSFRQHRGSVDAAFVISANRDHIFPPSVPLC